MKKLRVVLVLIGMCAAFAACKSPSVNAFYTFDTECMGSEMDGSVVLRAWGQGHSRSAAMEQAKNRLSMMLFSKGFVKDNVISNHFFLK